MENRNGFAYGIWLLLESCDHIPFSISHKLHITLISNISCKRKASDIYLELLKSNVTFPSTLSIRNCPVTYFHGNPLSSIGWRVSINNWKTIKHHLESYSCGIVPSEPHVSLRYFPIKNTPPTMLDANLECKFKCHLVLVDMNAPDPSQWNVVI